MILPWRFMKSPGEIASLPIGFLVSGFLHLIVLVVLVVSLSKPVADAPANDDAPIALTLSMFAEPSTQKPAPTVAPEPVEPQEPIELSEPPPREESAPVLEPKTEPPPPSKPKTPPAPKKKTPPPENNAITPKSVARKLAVSAPRKPVRSAAEVKEEQRYLAALRARIEQKKFYPRPSRRRGETGRVIVRFAIQKNGELADLTVVRSSGIARLDEAALKTLRRITPFKPIPAALGRDRWILSVPISYSLKG